MLLLLLACTRSPDWLDPRNAVVIVRSVAARLAAVVAVAPAVS